jgi:hypothetical protein
MGKDVNIDKVVRQHLEMEQFFSGFSLKGTAGTPEPQQQKEDDMTAAQKAAELEKIAEEVNQCRKCNLGSTRTNSVPGEGNPNRPNYVCRRRSRSRRRCTRPAIRRKSGTATG